VQADSTEQPIQWRPYSERARDAFVDNGFNVLVFARPRYAVAPKPDSIDAAAISTLFHDEKYVPIILEYDDWSGSEIRSLFEEVGHTKESFLVLCRPGEAPERVGAFSLKPFTVTYSVSR
jgi:hypothetical protein